MGLSHQLLFMLSFHCLSLLSLNAVFHINKKQNKWQFVIINFSTIVPYYPFCNHSGNLLLASHFLASFLVFQK